MSEKCDNCGRDFFVLSKREEKDVDQCKKETDMNLCDRCRKRYHENKTAQAFSDALSSSPKGRNLMEMMNIINNATGGRNDKW